MQTTTIELNLNTTEVLQLHFVDENGDDYTPNPLPVVTAVRILSSGNRDTLFADEDDCEEALDEDTDLPVEGYVNFLADTDIVGAAGAVEITFETSDAALVALGEDYYKRRVIASIVDTTWVDEIHDLGVSGILYSRPGVEPETGNVTNIVIGDAYSASNNRQFEWSNDAWATLGLTDADCAVTIYIRNQDGGPILLETEVEATSSTRVIFTPTSEQTKQLASLAGTNRQAVFQIKAEWADTPGDGPATLVDALILRVLKNRSN